MNEKKIKIAFSKVKKDLNQIRLELENLKNNSPKKTKHNLKNDFDAKLSEFAEMMDEKIQMEIAGLKLNFENELVEVSNKILNDIQLKKNEDETQIKVENSLNEFSEILNDRISLEINSLRGEFTEEIAKLYDKFFNEIVEFKQELKNLELKSFKNKKLESNKLEKKTKKTKLNNTNKKINNISENQKSNSLYESESNKLEKKKESKLKKVAKWLFVDENEEEEIKSIKEEIKNKE